MNVLVLVGSLRAGSFNTQLADAALAHLPANATVTRWDRLGELPFYSEDTDTDAPPASAVAFREAVAAADAILVATPEYNGTLPAVLKNAIDWASRPRGAAPIAGKRVAVIGASASPRGAQWAREDAVRSLTVAGAKPIEETVGAGTAYQAFTDGRPTDGDVDDALRVLLTRLVAEPVAA